VWALEATVVSVFALSFGVSLGVGQVMILVGCATLSTPVPTAPGFLGSLQLVFWLLLESFDHSRGACYGR
jgi:hypothetical protein